MRQIPVSVCEVAAMAGLAHTTLTWYELELFVLVTGWQVPILLLVPAAAWDRSIRRPGRPKPQDY
jgi:hypothetical protein